MTIEEVGKLSAALVTPALAIFGGYIAWRQSRTAGDKLKLDLFDRRYKIYSSFVEILRRAASRQRVSYEDIQRFVADTAETGFLFGPEIAALRSRLHSRLAQSAMFRRSLETEDASSDLRQNVEAVEGYLTEWLDEQLLNVDRLFHRYLGFDRLRPSRTREPRNRQTEV